MADKGHRFTDKEISALEKRIKGHYQSMTEAEEKRLLAYLKAHEPQINMLNEMLGDGRITQQEFNARIMTEIMGTQEWKDTENIIVNNYVEADAKAVSIVGLSIATIYAYNHNSQSGSMQKKLKAVGTKVNLPKAVTDKTNHLRVLIGKAKRKKRLLPPPNPDKMKDRLWHRLKIRVVVSNGLKHGKSIPKIADDLQTVTNMDIRAAYRAARTACTNAENQAKLDAMFTLRDEFGIDVKKMWHATFDDRTRTSHREIHGQICELEEPFSNKLQYPADPSGDPSEVWNCRCTLIDVISGIDMNVKQSPKGQSRAEWEKRKPISKPYPIPKGRK